MELHDRKLCPLLPHRRQRNRLRRGLGSQCLRSQCEYRDENVELHDRRLRVLLPHRRQRNRLHREYADNSWWSERLCTQRDNQHESVELYGRKSCALLLHHVTINRAAHLARRDSLITLPNAFSCQISQSHASSLHRHIVFNSLTLAVATVINKLHIWGQTPNIDIILNALLTTAASAYRHV